MSRRLAAALLAPVAMWAAAAAQAADPERGQRLFMIAPAAGELACADCHSDNPVANNFGNIWSGRNAVALIQRAVTLNTGGMGVFNRYYSAADLADIAAFLGNAPVRLDFPSTALGARSASQRVTVSASSKLGLNALQVQVQGDYVVLSPACPASLPPFGSCEVDIAFAPGAPGARDGSLLVTHDGTPTPVRVPLRGVAREQPPAVVALSASALDFGRIAVGGASGAQVLQLANRSAQPAKLGDVFLDAPDFVIDGGTCEAGRRLDGGQACVLQLRFEPSAAGARSASLAIAHDGAGEGSIAALRGDALPGPAPRPRLSAPVLRFGAADTTLPLRLHNAGSGPLTLGARTISQGGFGVRDDACGAVLAAGAACALQVIAPALRGAGSIGELRIDMAGRDAPLRVVLDAGVAPAEAAPEASALWLDAVAVPLGERAAQVMLANRGAAALTLDSLRLVGSRAAALHMGGTCQPGVTLPAQGRCIVELQRIGADAARATLVVRAGAAEALVTIDEPWPGVDAAAAPLAPAQPRLAAHPASLVFAAPAGAGGARQRVWLENRGAALLRLPTIGVLGSGFMRLPADDEQGCAMTDVVLLPGQGCAVDIAWTGGADARFGGELVVDAEAPAAPRRIALAVVDDGAPRNQGGGGAAGGIVLLGLALAWALLRGQRSECAR
ncbi:choice-of-anchor D domain-containing protein [Aquabacterium humicola]|uniref:choice-of-anchor D domain-containing protein n=1 Tax=Aquabacterium humicola TaxID=3237377 RepID=UPI0025434385|nr:choice-of-anchor D domain-containing protein [Rubrivivax pictus]